MPRCVRLVWNWFNLRDGLAFHLQIHFRVMIRRGWAGMTQIEGNGGWIGPGRQERHRRAMPHRVRVKPFLPKVGNIWGRTRQTPSEDVADPEPGQWCATVIQEHASLRP